VPKLEGPNATDLNETTNEIGGYGAGKEKFDFEIRQKIKHPGEINKARYMPQNPNLIATWSTNDGVLVWDITKHSLDPEKDKGVPEITCDGHEKEGFGLSWSPHNEGHLATASEDETVRLWDVDATKVKNGRIESLQTWRHHSAVVNDVQHHPLHKSWIATASDDLTWAIIDPRVSTKEGPIFQVQDAHTDAVNAIACHPKFEFTIATGSADRTVAIWDLRCPDKKVHSIDTHQDAVIQLQWHPQESAILTSGSYDRRIIIYDLSRTGEEQTEEEAEEGAPEMYVVYQAMILLRYNMLTSSIRLFMHGGFTNRLTEFDWNKNDPWWMLAAAEDNQLQIFRPARALVNTPPKKAITIGEIEE
jgi:histone-binding protein RBBP4